MNPGILEIAAEMTPNPNTLKFNVNRVLVPAGSLNFPDKASAKGSRLAEALFESESVLGVMAGHNFITVTKNPSASWQSIVENITRTIRTVLESDGPLFSQGPGPSGAPGAGSGANGDIERRIREILDNEIRPAVAMDGGDITFYGYENGVVTLHLQGSCSSCPSSILTLKMGVENRLKSLIPEVKEVVQVQ
ncbi:MAG: NifU family protein [Candidatus Omnitrophica bacterium]|nr:NifU family protein [Candidatus Omnitrophota bacterium]